MVRISPLRILQQFGRMWKAQRILDLACKTHFWSTATNCFVVSCALFLPRLRLRFVGSCQVQAPTISFSSPTSESPVIVAAAAVATETCSGVGVGRGFRGRFGNKGFSMFMIQGVKYYRAQTSVNRLYMSGRNRRSLEAVVQDHLILSQIRENLSAWFEKYGFNAMEKAGDEYRDAVEELQHANEVVLRDSGAGDDDELCTYFCRVSAHAHIGRQLTSPNTRSLSVCLGHLQRLVAASHFGWCHLRSVYIDLLERSDSCLTSRPSQAMRSTQTAAARLDALHDRVASRRIEIAQRREERRCRQAAAAKEVVARRERRLHKAVAAATARHERQLEKAAAAEQALAARRERWLQRAAAANARREETQRRKESQKRRHDTAVEEGCRRPWFECRCLFV